jgi:hypothetical protein
MAVRLEILLETWMAAEMVKHSEMQKVWKMVALRDSMTEHEMENYLVHWKASSKVVELEKS